MEGNHFESYPVWVLKLFVTGHVDRHCKTSLHVTIKVNETKIYYFLNIWHSDLQLDVQNGYIPTFCLVFLNKKCSETLNLAQVQWNSLDVQTILDVKLKFVMSNIPNLNLEISTSDAKNIIFVSFNLNNVKSSQKCWCFKMSVNMTGDKMFQDSNRIW